MPDSSCIPSFMLLLPGYPPLTTIIPFPTLNKFLPLLHRYILPSSPSSAILPVGKLSYTGLKKALQWREAEAPISLKFGEMIKMHAALSFLGASPSSEAVKLLSHLIDSHFAHGLAQSQFEELWGMRSLPFTEPFLKTMVKKLALIADSVDRHTNRADFAQRVTKEDGYAENIGRCMAVLRWVCTVEDLEKRVENMRTELEKDGGKKVKGKKGKKLRTKGLRRVEIVSRLG
ncbi:hypothetical protein P280DRAFT_533657 [Massarina eburnea CBS 473.64]|uniref:Uncharacterized protein n=1 Tax=Massarina eburnea CBS 473.64 TaxID=1395130 RepID=A0A6A6RMZ9_9PLEO|nr:hypothetical protein P280DRAFT_533657 [Massarina eburnea CBS 473.64]